MKLPAGDLGMAVGFDFHRDTTEDTKTDLGNIATYAVLHRLMDKVQ